MATFSEDSDFLKRSGVQTEILSDGGNTFAAVSGRLNARVLTASCAGADGYSFGWLNRPLLESGGAKLPHITPYGGEDRLWLGPEGGQFSPYFQPGKPFTFDNWQVPEVFDTAAWQPLEVPPEYAGRKAIYFTECELPTYCGQIKKVLLTREITVLNREELRMAAGGAADDSGLQAGGITTVNTLYNNGDEPWTRENGALSLWVLGMFNAGDGCRAIAPLTPDDAGSLHVKSDYFGSIPPDRLRTDNEKKRVELTADGNYRGKIGIPPNAAKWKLAGIDTVNRGLTLVRCSRPESEYADFVNAAWEMQEDPFRGDALNAYNDGPNPTGEQLGKFFELESSSPAAFLAPGERISHIHTTMHLQGEPENLLEAMDKFLN